MYTPVKKRILLLFVYPLVTICYVLCVMSFYQYKNGSSIYNYYSNLLVKTLYFIPVIVFKKNHSHMVNGDLYLRNAYHTETVKCEFFYNIYSFAYIH